MNKNLLVALILVTVLLIALVALAEIGRAHV